MFTIAYHWTALRQLNLDYILRQYCDTTPESRNNGARIYSSETFVCTRFIVQ
jgi:hypothetical protein